LDELWVRPSSSTHTHTHTHAGPTLHIHRDHSIRYTNTPVPQYIHTLSTLSYNTHTHTHTPWSHTSNPQGSFHTLLTHAIHSIKNPNFESKPTPTEYALKDYS